MVSFGCAGASGAVTVSLALVAPQDTGGNGVDKLTSIEVFIGSQFDDTLFGGPLDDTLDGREGTDACNGGGGTDTLLNCELSG